MAGVNSKKGEVTRAECTPQLQVLSELRQTASVRRVYYSIPHNEDSSTVAYVATGKLDAIAGTDNPGAVRLLLLVACHSRLAFSSLPFTLPFFNP